MANKLTPSDIRAAVRSIMDLPDPEDLSDSLMDLYMRDGYRHIIDLERRWRFLETSFSFTALPNVRAYDLDTIAATPMREIVSIVESTTIGIKLDLISYEEGEFKYLGAMDTPARPLHFAVWDNKIHLFPKPDTTYTLQVRGYREPIDWVTSATYVDASENLHFAIVYYIVSRVYQHQENTALAMAYRQSFEESVATAKRDVQRPDSFQPMVLSGARNRRRSFDGWLQSLGRDLENY